MKKLLGVVVVIAILVLGSYYGMGIVTERTLKKNVDMINRSNGLFVDIEHYDRGWFTAHALLNLRLQVPERLVKNQVGQSVTVPAQNYNFQMPISIFHGPIIVSDDGIKFGLGYAKSDLVLPQQYMEKFYAYFSRDSSLPKLALSLSVSYLNKSCLHVDLPNFKLIGKQGNSTFDWSGLNSSVSTSSNLDKIDGKLTLKGVQLIKDKIEATLGKVETDYKLHQADGGLYLGDATISLPSFVVTDNKKKVFQLDDFSVHSSSDISGGLFSSVFKTSLDKVFTHEKTYGPAELEMGIKNLDAEVLAKINEQINQAQQGQAQQRQQVLFALLPELPKLFGKGAQFEVSKLRLVMPEGEVVGNLLVSLPRDTTGNPFQLLQKIQGHGELKIPAPVLKTFVKISVQQKLIAQQITLQQAMMEQMKNASAAPEGAIAEAPAASSATPLTPVEIEQQAVQQTDEKLNHYGEVGLLSLRGTDYHIEISLDQGQLLINGKQFNPSMIPF